MIQSTRPVEDWMSIRLSDLKLTVRTSNCLYRMGLTTLGELAQIPEAELLRQPNFGRKCLSEVKNLLTSSLPPTKNMLDFCLIKEPLLSTLLRPVQSLGLTTRARNAMEILGIETIGELIQLKEIELLRTPNIGRLTIENYKKVLAEIGFSLDTTIANWPDWGELKVILESRVQSPMNRMQTPVGEFKFLEDELCAAVQMTVERSEYAIVVRRTGWDGGDIMTLEELGNDPATSGRSSTVSRERIRQIEARGLNRVQEKAWSMPILDRAVDLIEEYSPLAAASVQHLLERHQLSRRGLGFKAIVAAMKTFQVKWNLVCTTIGQELYLLPSEEADTIEPAWIFLIEEANRRDFVPLDQIEKTNQRATDFSSEITALGVSNIPQLDWLDQNRRIYWSPERARRGWNKIINVCCKILTVAPNVPIERLMQAVERARTITDWPSPDTFINMLRAADDVDFHDGVVLRGTKFNPGNLCKTDRLMINTAKEVGTVTTFLKLREALVRQGVSVRHAQQLMVKTPFWITPSRGKYRFIANNAQLEEFLLAAPTNDNGALERRECMVELEIGHRHLVTGGHRIDENSVRPGQWLLKDDMGNEFGMIDVTPKMIRGLSEAFAVAGIEVGTFVIIDFSDQQYTATVYY